MKDYQMPTEYEDVPNVTLPTGQPPVRSSEIVSLLESAIQLNEIVEGVRSRRWAYAGTRLKDMKEWCVFYVSLKRAIEQANDKGQR